MNQSPILINNDEAKILSELIENTLFKNGYDVQYDNYLKSLYEIKLKLETDKSQKQVYK